MNPLARIKLIVCRYFSSRNTVMIKLNKNTLYYFLMNFTGKEITHEKIISFPFSYYLDFRLFLNA